MSRRKIVANESLFLDCLKYRVDGLKDITKYQTLDRDALLKEFMLQVGLLRSWIEKSQYMIMENKEAQSDDPPSL